jgi:hypothetical protein
MTRPFAFIIQAPQPETLYPSEPQTGLSSFLCPSSWCEQLAEKFRSLIRSLLRQIPMIPCRQVCAVHRLGQFWSPCCSSCCTKSNSLEDIGNRRMLPMPDAAKKGDCKYFGKSVRFDSIKFLLVYNVLAYHHQGWIEL